MNKIYYLIGIFLFAILQVYSQLPQVEWANGIGSYKHDVGTGIKIDDEGFIYSVGYFGATVDFDMSADEVNLTAYGDFDLFIQKLNPDGSLIWIKQIGGDDSMVIPLALELDENNNIYICGTFTETVDFNPGADTNEFVASGYQDGFILKLNSSGDYLWNQGLGSTSFVANFINGISLDNNGSVYIGGQFRGTMELEVNGAIQSLVSNGSEDMLFCKLTENGIFTWAKSIGGINSDKVLNLEVGNSGNLYTTGFFSGTVDFNPNPLDTQYVYAQGGLDLFIQKLDPNGDGIWVRTMGGNGLSLANSIALDAQENIYITGEFTDTIDFDPGPNTHNLISNGGYDMYVAKLDSAGNYIWANGMGGNEWDKGYSLTLDPLNNVYISGSFQDTVDLSQTSQNIVLESQGSYDYFIQKIDSNGIYGWTHNFGGPFADGVYAMDVVNNSIYLTGAFDGLVNFGLQDSINIVSNGQRDLFIQKINICEYINTSVSVVNSAYLQVEQSGTTYQWLNCTDNSIIPGENTNTFSPTNTDFYAVEINLNGCIDTSECYNIANLGEEDFSVLEDVLIYPNPSSDILNVKFNKTIKKASLELISALGEKVYSKEIKQVNSFHFQLPKPQGVYFARIRLGEFTKTMRVIKN